MASSSASSFRLRTSDFKSPEGAIVRLGADSVPTGLSSLLCNPEVTTLGVDLSPEAIAHARARYENERVCFLVADARTFQDPEGFDSIVSLESIEHLSEPESFIAHIVGQLCAGGVFVASVPTTTSTDENPHHRSDLAERSFRGMVEAHGLREVACLRQVRPFKLLPLLTRREARAKEIRRNLLLFYLQHPASFVQRTLSTIRYGFTNHYLTVAWQSQS